MFVGSLSAQFDYRWAAPNSAMHGCIAARKTLRKLMQRPLYIFACILRAIQIRGQGMA